MGGGSRKIIGTGGRAEGSARPSSEPRLRACRICLWLPCRSRSGLGPGAWREAPLLCPPGQPLGGNTPSRPACGLGKRRVWDAVFLDKMRQSLSAALRARLGGRLAAAPGNIYVTRPVCPARPRPAPLPPPRPEPWLSPAPPRSGPAPAAAAGSRPGTPTPAWLLLRARTVARSSHSFPRLRRLLTWPDLNPLPLTKSKPHLAVRPPPHAQVRRVKALTPFRSLSVGVRWTWSGPGCTGRQSSPPGLEFRILVPILCF